MRRFKVLFTICICVLAGLMYAGSSYLGNQSAASIQSKLFHRGVPAQFEYLDHVQGQLVWTPPPVQAKPVTQAASIPVIYYHGITEHDTKETVGWETFRAQMFALKSDGYETVSLQQLQDFLQNGKPLPEKSFVLTFDDGRKDSYYPTDPVLQALNYRAVMFVITSNISERDGFYLSQSELQEMVDSGRWELGSHGRSIHEPVRIGLDGATGHPLSNRIWREDLGRLETQEEFAERIRQDLVQAKEDLQSMFGVTVNAFAFPYGDLGQGSTNNADAAREPILRAVLSEYAFAFYQPWEETVWRNFPGKDQYLVRRIEVKPGWQAADLVKVLDGGVEKPPSYADDFKADQGWVGGWGRTAFQPGQLTLAAEPTTTGATAFLDGTSGWGDVQFSVTAKLVRGESVSLLARGDANHNYVFCSFGRHGVSYGERIADKDVDGPSWHSDADLLADANFTATMVVKGTWVQCWLNGQRALVTHMSEKTPARGRVGVSVWGPLPGVSELDIFRITADPVKE